MAFKRDGGGRGCGVFGVLQPTTILGNGNVNSFFETRLSLQFMYFNRKLIFLCGLAWFQLPFLVLRGLLNPGGALSVDLLQVGFMFVFLFWPYTIKDTHAHTHTPTHAPTTVHAQWNRIWVWIIRLRRLVWELFASTVPGLDCLLLLLRCCCCSSCCCFVAVAAPIRCWCCLRLGWIFLGLLVLCLDVLCENRTELNWLTDDNELISRTKEQQPWKRRSNSSNRNSNSSSRCCCFRRSLLLLPPPHSGPMSMIP